MQQQQMSMEYILANVKKVQIKPSKCKTEVQQFVN